MEALFLKLVTMSITASYLVIAVILLRVIFKRAPKWIHCLLWSLVALRLLCPVTLESPVSLVKPEQTEYTVDHIMDDYVGSSRVYWDITEEYQTALDSGILPIHTEDGGSYVVTAADTPTVAPTSLSEILAPVWLVGLIAMALYALISYLAVRRSVRVSISADKTVRLCDDIDTPFILGIIRPVIYLPSHLDPDATAHVLAHEQAHLKRLDHWWKPHGYFLLSIYWFNPVLWLAYILLCRDIEQACDEKVVQALDTEGKKAYSMSLLKCSVPRRMIAACPLAFGEVGVKSRIKSVLNYKKPAFLIIFIAILAGIAAAVCFLTDSKDESLSAHAVTSELWIYDTQEADITVWHEGGSHAITLSKEEIETFSELIHGLQKDEFIKEKPKKQLLYAKLHCKDFDIELQWDGEHAYFTFDAATEALDIGNRRSVKNDELNAFLTELVNQEYRLAEGIYAPIDAACLYGEMPDLLTLTGNRRYEVSGNGLTVRDFSTGDVSSYVFDWCWEGLAEAQENLESFMGVNYHDSFMDLRIKMDDTQLKYQHLFADCHLILQDGNLYLIDGSDRNELGKTNWTIYQLAEYSPYLIPPTAFRELFENIAAYDSYALVLVRSGDCRPGALTMTEAEWDTLCRILPQIPDEAIVPAEEKTDYSVSLNIDCSLKSASCNALFRYFDGKVQMLWNTFTDSEQQCYEVDYAPLTEFLAGLMQPERIDNYFISVETKNNAYQYISYVHEEIRIALVKIVGWEYEIVPYVDDQTAFGIRCKPEWLDGWLFFGYMNGKLDPESISLYGSQSEAGALDNSWQYLFENPVEGTVVWREWKEPWKLIYRHSGEGTYFIYNEGEFDERLAEHDRGGYWLMENSFDFLLFPDLEEIISLSKQRIDWTDYENPEVTFDPETCSYNVLWHRKDSDGYAVVNVSSVWTTLVTEVAGTESE